MNHRLALSSGRALVAALVGLRLLTGCAVGPSVPAPAPAPASASASAFAPAPARGPAPATTAAAATTTPSPLAAAPASAPPALPAPPAASIRPVVDRLHGVDVPDPYRDLEDLKRPETREWLKAQGEHAAAVLERIEGRDALVARVRALADAGDDVRDVRRLAGARLFYLKRKVGEPQFKLVLRDGLDGRERVLVDPERSAQATGRPHAINYFVPSWDGRTVAYGLSAGGSEDASLHLIDVASGRPIGEPISRVHDGLVHWTPDSRTLTFNRLRELAPGTADTETYLDSTVFVLTIGMPASRARPLFGPLVNRRLKLDRLDVAEVSFAPDSRWMVARTTDTTVPEGRIYVAPVADLGRRDVRWRQVARAADKVTALQLQGERLLLRTYAGAPRGRVVEVPLRDPVLARARTVVPEPASGVLLDFRAAGATAILAEVRDGFGTRVRRHAAGRVDAGSDVAPRQPGSTTLVADASPTERAPWLVARSWTASPAIVAAEASGPRDTGLLARRRPADAPEIEVTEALVTSHDGARVPLAILHRKGLVLDGTNPTLLIGYGAYGITFEAFFDPRNLAWLERGGVLAYANVRGSGAFGDAWYRAGFKSTKPNTWKDGIACARWLIDHRYATPRTLGVLGGSAGGIFVGRAITSAPELFAAAVSNVGMMDAVRAEASANGVTNVSEFGSVTNADEFPALLQMSTYHQIRDGVAYPAVLFVHGLNDPRVDVWHSAKAAARLQAASSSGKPVLLRLDREAGHGVGSTAEQAANQLADIDAFLLWQFGKLALRR